MENAIGENLGFGDLDFEVVEKKGVDQAVQSGERKAKGVRDPSGWDGGEVDREGTDLGEAEEIIDP